MISTSQMLSAFSVFSVSPSLSSSCSPLNRLRLRFRIRSLPKPLLLTSTSTSPDPSSSSSALLSSLRVLEWDKVCDCVASFAGTALGRDATKEKLRSLGVSYEESKSLLAETAAAVEMLKNGVGGMDFSGVDVDMVKSVVEQALRGFPLSGTEALAVACLIKSCEILQLSLKAMSKEDLDRYNLFMPLTEMILPLIINRQLVNKIRQVIDDEGMVKDSASSELKRSREQVQSLEKKLYHLMDNLVRNDKRDASHLEITVLNGRWCLRMVAAKHTDLEGLLLSSGSGHENLVEPLVAVPLNDDLQHAHSIVAKAEEHVLSELTDMVLSNIDDIQKLLDAIIKLDVVFARAKYSLAYDGTFPEIYLLSRHDGLAMTEANISLENKWKLYLHRAYHPLLCHQHREKLRRARKEVSAAISETRRARSLGRNATIKDSDKTYIASLKEKVATVEKEHPTPIDVLIPSKTSVVVITGPNTGGKTISVKTIGLASLMAKSGLYVLASEPVKIPWFDAVFADIGDDQSLSQSLSTFSGHLRQITAIQSKSTDQSLVLLDEVGAGTNPLEGAALGMALLGSFAVSGALLTVATTHHGELKALKYRNYLFENACVEFDEVNLKPTYKILWGVPGRSNAINIAERLGLPKSIVDDARKRYGITSAEIDEVIFDMETFKQNFQRQLQDAKHFVTISKKHYESLSSSMQKITEHESILRTRKKQAISDRASITASLLRNILRKHRETSIVQVTKSKTEDTDATSVEFPSQETSPDTENRKGASITSKAPVAGKAAIPKIGDVVHVPSLGKKATVLEVEASKGVVMVQANQMKMRLKLNDVEFPKVQTQ